MMSEMSDNAIDDLGQELGNLSHWIDFYRKNLERDDEANLCLRVAKVAEEAGEAIKELIGVTGQNPRKGVYGSTDSLVKELLDTAATALAAVEHIYGNDGRSMRRFAAHLDGLTERAKAAGVQQ